MNKIKYVFPFLLKCWWRLIVPWYLRRCGVDLGKNLMFYGMPIVSMTKPSKIDIGDRVILTSNSNFTALGVSRRCILRTMQTGAKIEIGSDTGISGGVICAADSVIIGKECLLGADVVIADNDFHPLKPDNRRYSSTNDDIGVGSILIGDNVFIGTRAIILKGVSIGSDSVIGAGSVVTANIPSGVIAAGNPAQVIRKL